jgi:drug/metabolite transporter (DMT)-like permease
MTDAADNLARHRAYRRDLCLVLFAGVLWSSMGLVIRLMESASEWQILFYRSLGLAGFLFIVTTVQSGGRPLRPFRRAGLSAVLGGCALVLAFSGSVFAVVNTTVANAMFLFATAPFFAAIMGLVILGESVRRATWVAMLVGGLGVTLMVAEGLSFGKLTGNVAGIVSALGFALFTIALRWNHTTNMLPAVCLGGLFTAIVAGGMCLGTGQSFQVPIHDVTLAVGLGVFQLGAGLSVYTLGSKGIPAAELTLLSMTE